MKVTNRRCVRALSFKTLAAAKHRNLIAILAIVLTTMLFCSLLSVVFTINDGIQQANFRQVGGFAHLSLKNLTEQQYLEFKDDPQMKAYGLRRFVGNPDQAPFTKTKVEISYMDETTAHWTFCDPTVGQLPQEGTTEAATDTRVLELLGVEPAIGSQFTLTFLVDGVETTETFTLSGWWEYEEVIPANHMIVPQSRANDLFKALDIKGKDGMTGFYTMDVMLDSSLSIQKELTEILTRHGYQNEDISQGETYISTGVNWSYTGAQLYENMDATILLGLVGILALILFTGYLIIYNVFQISVSGDIRFYGLLKTIGTTGRQLKRIIFTQALCLSAVGIPLGLLAGYLVGALLAPVVIGELDGVYAVLPSVNPAIFLGATLFSLITVVLSCKRPGKMAAKVSPIEAVRYTEGQAKSGRLLHGGTSLPGMALANLGRNRGKTVLTLLSLALAVVLLNLTVTFTGGFDMDKYLEKMIASDFQVASSAYFQTGKLWNGDAPLEEDVIKELTTQPGVPGQGRVYGKASNVEQKITETDLRDYWNSLYSSEHINQLLSFQEREGEWVFTETKLYGMEQGPLDKMRLLEGDLSLLNQPGSIAAVYREDDYGAIVPDSHWAKLGERVTIRYVEEYEFIDPDTGRVLDPENIPDSQRWMRKAKRYRDVEYKVVALVQVPHNLSFRYYGDHEYILGADSFVKDSGTDLVMHYTFDAPEENEAALEQYLFDRTSQNADLNYESKASYIEEFMSFRRMFVIMGSFLCGIVGLVGILNFVNATMTSILCRRREFAVLQAVGMSGAQLKGVLIWEGLYYTLGSIVCTILLILLSAPLLAPVLTSMFWFFNYRFTLLPVLAITPLFLLLGTLVPLVLYRLLAKQSIVERLKEIG